MYERQMQDQVPNKLLTGLQAQKRILKYLRAGKSSNSTILHGIEKNEALMVQVAVQEVLTSLLSQFQLVIITCSYSPKLQSPVFLTLYQWRSSQQINDKIIQNAIVKGEIASQKQPSNKLAQWTLQGGLQIDNSRFFLNCEAIVMPDDIISAQKNVRVVHLELTCQYPLSSANIQNK